MNKRIAAPVVAAVSLAALLSGCAGTAVQAAPVRDDLSPIAGAAALGIARGHVIVKDDLSPLASAAEDRVARAAEQAAHAAVGDGWSAQARRELHAQPAPADAARGFSAEARRALHSQPTAVEGAFTADVMRELKGSAPSVTDPADDDLSPLRGIR